MVPLLLVGTPGIADHPAFSISQRIIIILHCWDPAESRANSKGSDQAAQLCSLIRAFAVSTCTKVNFSVK